MTHAKMRAAALVLPLALLLSGCSMSGATAGDSDSNAGAAPNSSSSASVTTDAKTTDDGTAPFGKTYTYDDGLAITVTDKGTFKPSQYAVKKKAKHYRKFQVTVKNGTDEAYDTVLTGTSLQDGEEEAEAVYDDTIGSVPTTKLRPGKTVKWTVGYGVDTDDLTMDVTPGFGHDAVTFVSK